MSMVAPNADDINILETGVLFPFKIEETWKFLCLLIEKHQPHFLQLQQVHATTDNVHQGLFSFHKPIFSSPSSNCRAMWLRSCCVRGKGFSYYWLHLAGHSYYFLPLLSSPGTILFPGPVTIVSLHAAHGKETSPYIITSLSIHHILIGWHTLCYAHWEIFFFLLTTEDQISPKHNFQKVLFQIKLEYVGRAHSHYF